MSVAVPRRILAPLLAAVTWGCADPTPVERALLPRDGASADVGTAESQSRIVVDASEPQGDVIRFERASTHSTSSPLPGEATRDYMRRLDHDVVRTWIQVRYVYNNGNVDYNYPYESSGVGAEDALRFYASAGKQVLVALSAYNPTSQWKLPQGEAFETFLKETLVYYKTKYPNIRFIQVGNEPDAGDETMATYYPMYQRYYRAVNAANAAMGLGNGDRLLITNGAFTSNTVNMLQYADGFLAAYAADPDPAKRLDVFTFHVYGETDRPAQLGDVRQRIDAAMAKHGLPSIPTFVTEYGVFGGSTRPVRFTDAQLVTLQPAGQLTKALYLYESGVDEVFNWAIHHGSLPMKSQLANVQTATPYPYGNALLLARELSARKTRISATSSYVNSLGIGTHAVAAMKPGDGIAVLVWNYHWRTTPTQPGAFNVHIKGIPRSAVGGSRMRATVYVIDSKTNNVYTNPAQTSLVPSSTTEMAYAESVDVPLDLEPHAVALVLLTRK
ncbi:cellulase family glycosylhydrolase [Roseisolibacter agri]|uniref:Uncharacterized protein n=1 Tax=Roseisolibacter agri TaxID=2014610 RepID=A0AA37PZM4_9BACT|nr:cellulase family glycosylhydrolase [Roseisolibacter agri]GLC23649.1 hypothetical protein rosag_01620 [Roseisolibacter agri]